MKKLSRAEAKKVSGGYLVSGGSCAYLAPTGSGSGGPVVTYGVSRADAIAGANAFGGRWCCDSCLKATWYGI